MDSADLLRLAVPIVVSAVVVPLVWTLWSKSSQKVFLSTKDRKRIRILDVTELSHNTKRFRLDLGGKKTVLGLPVGKHVVLYAPNPPRSDGKWNGKEDKESAAEIQRKYTPVTGNETPGYVDLVVKIYRPGKVRMSDGNEIEWSDGGKGSLYLDRKKPGDFIDIMGPVGLNEYVGQGTFKIPGRTVKVKQVGLMAGGTGLTPMLQIVTASLRDPADETEFSMIYANKTEDDILCKDLLEEAVAKSNGRFKVHYTLDFPPAGWKHKTGFITHAMIKECLPPPSEDTIILMCGPPPMIEFACKKNLEALGYPKTSMIAF